MKKKFTFLMALFALILIVLPVMMQGQTRDAAATIYNETFGTTGNKTNVSDYTGWSSSLITPSSTGWKISEPTQSSCNLTGSSGSCNAYCGTTSDIIFDFGDKLSGYTNVKLSFNYYKGSGKGKVNTIKCYISSNGGTTYGSDIIPSNTGSVGWYAVTNIAISDASLSNLCIKFSTSTNTNRLDDILLTGVASTPTITVSPTSITDFFYVQGHGPSESQEFTVSGSNLGSNTISVSVTDNYEISSNNSSFGSSVTPLAPTAGTVGETTLYVRMKEGLTGNPSGTITASSTGATSQTISLSGSVTPTYTVTCATGLSNGSIVSDKETAASGETVTITATPASGYKLATVTVTETGGSNTVTPSVSGNTATFTMPAYNVTVSATFAQEYTITCATGLSYGSIVSDKETAVLGETVTVTATPASGYKLSSVTVTKEGGGTVSPVSISGNTATFAMPAYNVTVSATFALYFTVTYNGNDNTGGSVPEDNNTYFYDDDVTVLGNTGSLVKTHYTFSTWNTANNGSGDNRTPESTFQIKGNTTLYAIYTPNENGYDLTLDGETSHATAKLQKYVSSTWTDVVEEEEIPYNTLLKVATTPDDGYDCIVTVIDNDDNTIELNVNNEFRMPDAKITITVNIVPDNEVTYDFHFNVMGDTDWGTDYVLHTVSYPECDVVFSSANKQASGNAITDIPVTKGQPVEIKMKNGATLSDVSFTCRQWGEKPQTITLQYSTNGGESYYGFSPAVTSTDFSISKSGLPTGTNAVKITFSNSTNQVGIESATIIINKKTVSIDDDIANGSVSADKTSIIPGRKVTLTPNPDDGYVFDSWDVYKTVDSETKVTVTDNKFTMPGYDVTVSATFRAPTTFIVHFSINGAVDEDLTQSNIAEGNPIDLPTGITCAATSLPFKGWSTSETEVVSVLSGSYTPTASTTLYAVFGNNPLTYSFSITPSDFVTGGYAVNDGEKTSVATTSGSETMNVKWTSSNVMLNSTTMQWKKSNGYIYNSTNLGTITNVSITSTAGGYTKKFGTSENEGCTSSTVGNGYFKIIEDGTNTGLTTNVTVTFIKKYYYTRFIDVSSSVNLGGAVPTTYIYTIKSTGTLTITGNLGDENNLIVENGGELIVSSTRKDVRATVKKTVEASIEATLTIPAVNYWYAISSPTHDDGQYYESFSNVSNLTPEKPDYLYNVYRYDEKTVVWQEHRDKDNEFNTMKKGRGYLFRTTKGGDLEYVGAVNTDTVQYNLSWSCPTEKFKGFNLIGNPYTHTIYKGLAGSAIPNGSILEAKYYTIGTNGRLTLTADGTAIAPGQAIFVQATSASESTLTMNNSTSGEATGKYANDNIWFMVKNAESSDLACVEFRKGHGLNKVEHRNDITPMLYIMHNGENFASADMSDNTSVINLGFEAKTTGEYTFSLKARGTYSYMHLIDKITGADVDMLIEDSYSFVGSPRDRKDRFELRLNYNAANIDSESDIFAYQNGADIIVRGEGELQVFDVTGRMAMKRQINGVQTVNGLNNGVYIFRLVGTEVKTQKIVVR